MISLIVPCYNEEAVLPHFYAETKKVLCELEIKHELLFINDGSEDKTLDIIKSFAEQDDCVQYISLSRNFGKEAAMYAGFCNTHGDYVAVIDADLQDPPSLIPEMLEIINTGNYDSVATRRMSRNGEPILRSWFAKQFYKLINKISEADVVDGARDFRLMKRDMVDAIIAMSENNRFSKGIFGWVGFRTYWLPYKNVERAAGSTKWSFWKLLKYGLDGITSFSHTPLNIASWLGLLMTVLSFFAVIFIFVRRLVFGDPVAGWASTACIIIFIGGIQLLCLGIIGRYLAKTYVETKNRPHYIAAETNIKDAKKIR